MQPILSFPPPVDIKPLKNSISIISLYRLFLSAILKILKPLTDVPFRKVRPGLCCSSLPSHSHRWAESDIRYQQYLAEPDIGTSDIRLKSAESNIIGYWKKLLSDIQIKIS
jgi:hypothetical protein